MGWLCLSRKVGEAIVLAPPDRHTVRIMLKEKRGRSLRLFLELPGDVGFTRGEVSKEPRPGCRPADQVSGIVVNRKIGEVLYFALPGFPDPVEVKIDLNTHYRVRFAIMAPREVVVDREEIFEAKIRAELDRKAS